MKANKKVKKYGIPFMLALAVTAAAVAPVPAHASVTNPYSDVTPKDGHYEAIVNLTEKGIVTGVTKTLFQSTKPATRGEAALFIANALGLQESAGTRTGTAKFSDLPAASPYYDAVYKLYDRSIIGGYTDGTFRPNAPLKRSEIAKMLTLAFELEMADESITKFADVNVIADTSTKRYIRTLIDYSITTGTTATTFSPYATLTRGQLATFLSRTMDAAAENFTVISVTVE